MDATAALLGVRGGWSPGVSHCTAMLVEGLSNQVSNSVDSALGTG